MMLSDKESYNSFLEFMQSNGRQDILFFWRSAKALKDLFTANGSGQDAYKPEDVTVMACNMLQLWQDFFLNGTSIDKVMHFSPESLKGYNFVISQFATPENERLALIDTDGVKYMYSCMDEAYAEMLREDFPRYLKSDLNLKKSRANLQSHAEYDPYVVDSIDDAGSPRKKIGQTLIDTVFKRRSKKVSLDSGDERPEFIIKLFETPKKVEKSDNVQADLSSLLKDENFFGSGRLIDIDDDSISPDEAKRSIMAHIRNAKDELRSKASSFFTPVKLPQKEQARGKPASNQKEKRLDNTAFRDQSVELKLSQIPQLAITEDRTNSSQALQVPNVTVMHPTNGPLVNAKDLPKDGISPIFILHPKAAELARAILKIKADIDVISM
jgi:hypothetical protein